MYFSAPPVWTGATSLVAAGIAPRLTTTMSGGRKASGNQFAARKQVRLVLASIDRAAMAMAASLRRRRRAFDGE
jgi:hypothetical protein